MTKYLYNGGMVYTSKCLLCLGLSLLVSVGHAASPLRIMSFNIRYDASPGIESDQPNAWLATSGQHRRDLALQSVEDYDPDLLCVQEALTNQIADLRAALPEHDFYGVGRDDSDEAGEYCGIFFRTGRFESLQQGTFWLNENPDKPGTRYPKTCCARIASWIILRDKAAADRELLLLNTHWDHQIQEARLYSAKLIRQRLRGLASGRPVVLAGDLNVTTDNPAFQLLITPAARNKLSLLDSFRTAHPRERADEGTFHAFRGNTDGARIDFVLCSEDYRIRAAEIIRTHSDERYPSDHFPVAATLIPVD